MERKSHISIEYVRAYYFRYLREYRAVAVLWGLLTIIWCILNVVCFIQPQWIGDTEESPGFGHVGVYAHCYPAPPTFNKYSCNGTFGDFSQILNDPFRASTFFCGVAALLMLICVAALLLFFCFKKIAVFIFCGVIELVTAIFLFLACIIYPAGWDHSVVTTICGDKAGPYKLGECGIRWAYILAMLGIFDAAILAILAFFLASKRASYDLGPREETVIAKSVINGGYAESKISTSFQPRWVDPGLAGVDMIDTQSDVYSRPHSRRGFQL